MLELLIKLEILRRWRREGSINFRVTFPADDWDTLINQMEIGIKKLGDRGVPKMENPPPPPPKKEPADELLEKGLTALYVLRDILQKINLQIGKEKAMEMIEEFEERLKLKNEKAT